MFFIWNKCENDVKILIMMASDACSSISDNFCASPNTCYSSMYSAFMGGLDKNQKDHIKPMVRYSSAGFAEVRGICECQFCVENSSLPRRCRYSLCSYSKETFGEERIFN